MKVSSTGPPGEEETPALAANRGFRNESKRSERSYSAAEFSANNHSGPGTQGRFGFDDGAAFSDRHIEGYLAKLGRELSDDQLRDFCHARYRYEIFQRSGAAVDRKYAWFSVQLLACRQSAEARHINWGKP